MNLKDIRTKLDQIERTFAVNTLTYKNVVLWPLIRFHIVKLSKGQIEIVQPQAELNWKGKTVRTVKTFFKNARRQITGYSVICSFFFRRIFRKNSIIISLSDVSGKNVQLGGQVFSKFSDTLSLVLPQYEVLDLIQRKNNKIISGYSNHLVYSDFDEFYLNSIDKNLNRDILNFIKDLNLELEKIGLPLIKSEILLRQVGQLLNFEYFFRLLTKFLKPKAVFIGCFYSPQAMALSWVSSQKKIPSIELQHGQQGDYHSMYTGWKSIPNEGYRLLPKYFAMWGQSSEMRIAQWSSNTNYHVAKATGNPWLGIHNAQKIVYDLDAGMVEFLKYVGDSFSIGNKKKLLVCLQPISEFPEECIPDHLLKAMISNSRDFYWHIRLHPKMYYQLQEYDNYFSDLKIENYNVKESTLIPLYKILNHVDMNLTLWSSVSYEALSFGVPTILLHENGLNAMEDYVNRGFFFYAPNQKKMIDILNNPVLQKKEDHQYIIGDLNFFIERVSQMMNE